MGDSETVTGLVECEKKIGAGVKNKNYPLPPKWSIALNRLFSVKISTFPDKINKFRQKVVQKFYGLETFPGS